MGNENTVPRSILSEESDPRKRELILLMSPLGLQDIEGTALNVGLRSASQVASREAKRRA